MIKNVMVTVQLLTNPSNLRALLLPFRAVFSRMTNITLGFAIGMILVYLSFPGLGIKFTGGDPVHLSPTYKDQWVKNVAIMNAQGSMTDDVARDALQDAGYGPTEVQALADASASDPALQQALLGVKDLPSQEVANQEQSKISTPITGYIFPLCCLFLFFLLGSVVGILGSFMNFGKRTGVTSQEVGKLGDEDERRKQMARDAAMLKEMETESAASVVDLGEPITTELSAYILGNDLFDDSFEIEPDGMFAGQCGISISETIGAGDPKKVTAFEVWVFDQEEIQTLTYVLMSEYAYNDPSLRDKLAPRGEAVMATPGLTFFMDTRKLKMRVVVVSMQYGEGSLPTNSFIEKLSVQLTIWSKDGSEASSTPSLPTPIMALPSQPMPPAPQPMPQMMPPQGMPMPPQQGGMPPQGQPMPYPPQQGGMPPQGQPMPYPPQQGGMPPQGQPMPPQVRPLGAPPQGMPMPPQQGGMPPQGQPMPYPPQQGGMPPQQGGIRPIGMPPQGQPMPPQTGRAPMPPQQGGGAAPLPGRQAPPTDDPFGDTSEM